MAAYYFELLIPLFFFVPVKHELFRTLGVAFILLFHLLNELTLLIGLFPFIGMATSLGLLPSAFLDRLQMHSQRIRLFFKSVWSWATLRINAWFSSERSFPQSSWRENLVNVLVVFLLVYVLDWNYSNLKSTESKLPEHLRFIGYMLRLDQHWGMFAPNVLKDDGWYVLEGITSKGDTVNVAYPHLSVNYKKPSRVVSNFKNDRWRKYMENYMLSNNEFMRGYFCHYKMRLWNEAYPERPLESLRITYVREFTLPEYKLSPAEKMILWQCE